MRVVEEEGEGGVRRALCLDRRGDGVGGACEDRYRRVAFPLLEGAEAAVVDHGSLDQRRRAGGMAPELRRGLDVGQEEGDDAGRKLGGHCHRAEGSPSGARNISTGRLIFARRGG
jgi:hypothetical protein